MVEKRFSWPWKPLVEFWVWFWHKEWHCKRSGLWNGWGKKFLRDLCKHHSRIDWLGYCDRLVRVKKTRENSPENALLEVSG